MDVFEHVRRALGAHQCLRTLHTTPAAALVSEEHRNVPACTCSLNLSLYTFFDHDLVK